MRTARTLLAIAALAAVIGWSSAATAVTFDLDVFVGFVDATGTCSAGSTCLGFAGGDATTSTRLNWDNATNNTNSYLSIGALPDVIGFPPNVPPVGSPSVAGIPTGTGTGTITDNNSIVRTAQIRHTNNVIPVEDNDLATITLDTLLTLSSGGNPVLTVPLSEFVTFQETANNSPCPGANPFGSICDDVFTINIPIFADIPFSSGGQDFILHIRGLVDANNQNACQADGLTCFTAEGQQNDRFVIASLENVTEVDVPAPAGLLLLGMGLVGMVIRKRLSA
jgi:PEP-CTERM motif